MTKFKTAYSKKEPVGFSCEGDSMTQQQFKKDCDINHVLERWMNTGIPPEQLVDKGQYLDCPDAMEFADAINIVNTAEDSFYALPSGLRQRFQNDPFQFLQFLDDPQNHEEAVRLGIFPKNVQKDPQTSPKSEEDVDEK